MFIRIYSHVLNYLCPTHIEVISLELGRVKSRAYKVSRRAKSDLLVIYERRFNFILLRFRVIVFA